MEGLGFTIMVVFPLVLLGAKLLLMFALLRLMGAATRYLNTRIHNGR